MDCFLEGPNFLVIDPTECIDCSVCVPECPVNAIVNAEEISDNQRWFIELNERLAKHPHWKRITTPKEPLTDHEAWAAVKRKLHLLQVEP